ncbi:hypothetical protein [Desulfosarcina ovata]|uniref:hypothetical protein n=1 Tax=Desulfosarcina ovata TaxID=83564 RepID=UPI0013913F13|nr:hypothetical protein [Desulfosarcina ovata]
MHTIQLPDAAFQQRTLAVVETVNQRLAKMPDIRNWVAVPGYSLMDDAIIPNAMYSTPCRSPWGRCTSMISMIDSCLITTCVLFRLLYRNVPLEKAGEKA